MRAPEPAAPESPKLVRNADSRAPTQNHGSEPPGQGPATQVLTSSAGDSYP